MEMTRDQRPSKQVIDYASTPETKASPNRHRALIGTLGFATFMALGIAGVGSDFVRIPTVKKIVLTSAVVVVVSLLAYARQRASKTFRIYALICLLYLLLALLPLWTWN